MEDQAQREKRSKVTKRGDGTALQQSEAPRNPMKRTMDTSGTSEDPTSEDNEPEEAPVIRGDGTVLPKRTEEQPRNPMKRTMDTSKEL